MFAESLTLLEPEPHLVSTDEVFDADLAAELCYKHVSSLRKLIRRLIQQRKLTRVACAPLRVGTPGRPGVAYWLTPEQCAVVRGAAKTERWEREGCIYFMSWDPQEPIKLGYTTNDAQRLASAQTGCPHRLRYELVVPGTLEQEQALHERLRPYRKLGEWYRRVPEVQAVMDELRYEACFGARAAR